MQDGQPNPFQVPLESIDFPERNVEIAKDQPEYRPLFARSWKGDDGIPRATFCWKLTPEQIAQITETGCLWHTVLTFGQKLQPQMLSVDKPAMR